MTLKKILIFAGTTEGRRLSEILAASGISHTVSVATEYGELVMEAHPCTEILCGRMDEDEMETLLRTREFSVVVDATHPYAVQATENIRAAAEGAGMLYLRLQREEDDFSGNSEIRYFDSHEACAKALGEISGNVLLTTGSKALSIYCQDEKLRERLYARVLPGMESLAVCAENGLFGKQVLALQGPFSKELNEALIRQYRISCLVTKMSGRSGGFSEKLQAAQTCGIPVFVVGKREWHDSGLGISDICERLEDICGMSIEKEPFFEITLAGCGMGSRECRTEAVNSAITEADFLFGAKRLLETCGGSGEKAACYRSEDILSHLYEIKKREMAAGQTIRVTVLFSGDSGFYSGSRSVFRGLSEAVQSGKLRGKVRVLPGISSVSYLAAAVGKSYEDAEILSLHGRDVVNLANKLSVCQKCVLLLSGAEDIRRIGQLLISHERDGYEITVGVRLSEPDEEILCLTPEECLSFNKEGLLTCMIKNPEAGKQTVTHGMPDPSFIRGKVPMTKEEIREVSICKLHLSADSAVYDIGSGTGSIAVEMARLSDKLTVFAIERKDEAVSLIRQNAEKHGLENIHIVHAEAPDGLKELPAPTHAFIGGSGKRLPEILDILYRKNPSMRIVLTAVTLETAGKFLQVLSDYPVKDEEIIQLQVNRTERIGGYHMMKAENPVWICSFTFVPERDGGIL